MLTSDPAWRERRKGMRESLRGLTLYGSSKLLCPKVWLINNLNLCKLM